MTVSVGIALAVDQLAYIAMPRCPKTSGVYIQLAGEGTGGFAGSANLLVMPSLDAANILFTVLRVVGAGKSVNVDSILLGAADAVHILSSSATARIVNMTALAVAGVR